MSYSITSCHIASYHITLHCINKITSRPIHAHTYTNTHTYTISQIADLCQPPGVGDKKILRTLAFNLGLVRTSSVVKRAIQFGTRVAKHTNVMYHGSNRKGKGDTRIWCHVMPWYQCVCVIHLQYMNDMYSIITQYVIYYYLNKILFD